MSPQHQHQLPMYLILQVARCPSVCPIVYDVAYAHHIIRRLKVSDSLQSKTRKPKDWRTLYMLRLNTTHGKSCRSPMAAYLHAYIKHPAAKYLKAQTPSFCIARHPQSPALPSRPRDSGKSQKLHVIAVDKTSNTDTCRLLYCSMLPRPIPLIAPTPISVSWECNLPCCTC